MIEWLQDEQGAVALDTRHHPVVIVTWEGTASVDLVDRYFCWSDAAAAAAMAQEQQLVHITDMSRGQLPSARVRKRIIEHSALNPAVEVALAHIMVVPEFGLRGLVRTVARFVQPQIQQPQMMFAGTVEEAIEVALGLLWEARIPPPFGLNPERYQAPRIELAP